MTTLREAAQQALEAWDGGDTEWFKRAYTVMEALRAALAETVQEPVAWMVYTEGGTSAYVTDNPNDLVGAYRALPLYTAAPQRKPLTEEEIGNIWDSEKAFADIYAIARAIERAHGIV